LERSFRWRDHAALWFSLGVGLLVIQTGAYIAPAADTRIALLATAAGSLIGAALLAWTAKLGCDNGLSSAGLMQRTFGSRFARLPVLLNVVQLIGWTTYELVIMRDGTLAVAQHALGWSSIGSGGRIAATALWGLILLALLAGSMVTLVRRLVSRIALPLVVASLAWLTWQFAGRMTDAGVAQFLARSGDGSMGFAAALDLVIAMPVSWLPLVADYARHGRLGGRGPGSAFTGTWLGYAVANIWCYGLGVLVVGSGASGTDMLTTMLLAQGGLVALGLILVDELDNAYGDVYSGSVSIHSMLPGWSVRRWGLLLAGLSTLFAMALPMRSLEPFLLLLSSVFVPLFGVILARLGSTSAGSAPVRIDKTAALLWLSGILLYHALAQWAPQYGATLPTLAFTLVAAWLTRRRQPAVIDTAR
jgi:putative hydroxymethylpyrimidine transporter CytX